MRIILAANRIRTRSPVSLATDATQPTGFKVAIGPFVPPPAVAAPGPGPAPGPAPAAAPPVAQVPPPPPSFLLYWAVKMYFDNGGGQCYIVSTGDYKAAPDAGDDTKGLKGGLAKVKLEDEPTLLVVPDAVKLDFAGYQTVVQAMALLQCGELKDCFCIFDVYAGDKKLDDEIDVGGGVKKQVPVASRGVYDKNLKYGAAYYPFLKTSINDFVLPDNSNVKVTLDGALEDLTKFEKTDVAKPRTRIFNLVRAALKDHFITMPPSGAVAGLYAVRRFDPRRLEGAGQCELSPTRSPIVTEFDNCEAGGPERRHHRGKSRSTPSAPSPAGHPRLGRAHAGGQRQRMAVHPRPPFLHHGRGIGQEVDALGGVRTERRQPVDEGETMIENYLIHKWRDGALAGANAEGRVLRQRGARDDDDARSDILEGKLNRRDRHGGRAARRVHHP